MGFFDFFSREKKETLDTGLQKTKQGFFDKIKRAVVGKDKVDDDVLDNLEEVLVTSDVGVETTVRIIERIEERVARDKYVGTDELNFVLKDEICQLLSCVLKLLQLILRELRSFIRMRQQSFYIFTPEPRD